MDKRKEQASPKWYLSPIKSSDFNTKRATLLSQFKPEDLNRRLWSSHENIERLWLDANFNAALTGKTINKVLEKG